MVATRQSAYCRQFAARAKPKITGTIQVSNPKVAGAEPTVPAPMT